MIGLLLKYNVFGDLEIKPLKRYDFIFDIITFKNTLKPLLLIVFVEINSILGKL